MNNGNPKSIEKFIDDWKKRSHIERRAARDNRSPDKSSEYLSKGGKERRKWKERRHSGERRDGWLRVGRWRSVSVFDE